MAVELTCNHCRKPFEGRPNRLYCSIDCRRKQERHIARMEKMKMALRRLYGQLADEHRGGHAQSAKWTRNRIDRIERTLAEQA